MKKKILSMLLCFTLIICVIPQSSFAQTSRDTSFEEELATDLKALGLFKGVSDTNFDLNREPTRVEALVMLIRVLGKEAEALNSNCSHPFTDVPAWADKYVGYAYENGLTKGTSATTFGTENANSKMYITFVLRALGYSDGTNGDFSYDNPYGLAKKVGLLPQFVDTEKFLRADVVTISYAALVAKINNSEVPLYLKLEEENVFSTADYIENYDHNAFGRKQSELLSSYENLTPEEIFAACSPAVFSVTIWDGSSLQTVGSGFFINSDGLAITNYHVIEGTDFATISPPGLHSYSVMGVLHYDKDVDYAIIKTNATNVPYIKIGDSDLISEGEKIYTIGNPQGLANSISDGIVANSHREELNGMIQITAPISPGSSGGALLNSRGEVIGITTATLTSGQNLNFAVPINDVINKNELAGIENRYNVLTMEQFATVTGAYDKIAPPKNIRVVRQQNGSAHIQWDKVEGAEYYHFYYQEAGEDTYWFDEDDNGEKLKFEYCDDYTVSFNGLENGKIYNVIVTSVKNGVESNDSEILTFVFNSSSVSQKNAFNQLKSFIISNANDSINGKQMYRERYESGNALKQYSLDYNAETDLITITVIYRGNYTSYTYVGLTPDEPSYFSMLSYYSASNQTNNSDFMGTFYVYPNNYDLNSQISFIKKEGDTSNDETYKVMALMNSLEGLDFTDYIFKTYLSGKNVSLSDFGFNVPTSGYTPVNFGNPIKDNTNNYQSGNNYQGGGSYSINTKITFSSFPLYLYADDGTGTFLGEISSNKYDTDSIANEYGNYGSKYQTKSIFNQYGNYGSKYSQYSVFNEYATHPPKILDNNGKVVGYLTANKYIKDAISYEEMMVLLKKFNK